MTKPVSRNELAAMTRAVANGRLMREAAITAEHLALIVETAYKLCELVNKRVGVTENGGEA
jgi:hypothetical protein